MLNFPKSTEFNKRIPKQKFYDNLKVTSNLEQLFTKEIDTIYWRNKLSVDTINVSTGETVKEIEIFEVNLKEQNISKNIIEVIDREIPYHLVFILRFNEMAQIWISFKVENKIKDGRFKVDSYYKTDWVKYEVLNLELDGLNLDKIYENFLLQVSNGKLIVDNGEDIIIAVAKAKEREKLESLIKNLEKQIKNEKQYNLQVKLMAELRKAKKMLETA